MNLRRRDQRAQFSIFLEGVPHIGGSSANMRGLALCGTFTHGGCRIGSAVGRAGIPCSRNPIGVAALGFIAV
jgi:hypothetical protein